MTATDAPARHALLIGSDFYFPRQIDTAPNFGHLYGCVRDVSHVEAALKQTFEIPDDHITRLRASHDSEDESAPAEPKEQWPTYENLVKAFTGLTERAAPGDHVYIQYSGHGGRAVTVFPELKGENGLDEGLVPIDIGLEGGQYLRDIEMARLFQAMVEKGLVVSVVFDCCHSGGLTRGQVDGVGVRGSAEIDRTPRPTASLVASHEELGEHWKSVTEGATRGVSAGSGWLPEPKGYTFLAACRPSETAYEFAFDGKERNGALTYWLLDSLETFGPGASFKMLLDRIIPRVHSQFTQQTPQLQGEGDKVFLGADRVRPQYKVGVMQLDESGDRVQLNAGQAHGLRKGAQFAIYPPGTTDFSDTDARTALADVTEIGAADSWADVTKRFSKNGIEQGSQAVLIGAGSVKMVQKVHLATRDDIPEDVDQAVALDAVRAAMTDNPWLELAEGEGAPDYQVALEESGNYEIWDRTGAAIENLRPPVAAAGSGAAETVVKRLEHLARYHAVEQLDNHDRMSPLAGKLVVELAGHMGTEYDPADEPEPVPFDDPEGGGTPTVEEGTWVLLNIRNDSDKILNVTVLDLLPTWGVEQVYPSGAGDYFVPLDPGETLSLPMEANLPEGYDHCTDVIKVFGTVESTNFRWLELPSLDQPPVKRAATRAGAVGGLEALMQAMGGDKPLTRNMKTAAYPSREWATAQVELRQKKAS